MTYSMSMHTCVYVYMGSKQLNTGLYIKGIVGWVVVTEGHMSIWTWFQNTGNFIFAPVSFMLSATVTH